MSQWLTLDSMSDLVQVGRDFFAVIWDGLLFKIDKFVKVETLYIY
jgi:hypothetical protein